MTRATRPHLAPFLTVTLLCGACGSASLKPIEVDQDFETENQLQLTELKDVDILFVIDNSGSMGEEQANLAANFGAFIEVLEENDVEANYRIGVTTSDNGNPWCPAGQTTPEGGKLVLSSCRSRLEEFSFNGEDVQDLACNDICALEADALTIQPTSTDVDPDEAPRPWLQRIEGYTNLPPGTSTVDAFRCFGPQGINGCGFESQLESMYLALRRAQTATEDSYGFLRAAAILAVVFVTDEVDCSYNKDWSEIFDADGERVFWSDPASPTPTSAVCWNAGVECFGDPNFYDDCIARDYDVFGNPDASEDDAVLHPLSRYLGQLQGIEADKQGLNPNNEVIVGVIGGVDEHGISNYADVHDSDPEFHDKFGIGPGCTGPMGEAALPPVRLREFSQAFTPDNLHSICATDYTGALERIADAVRTQIIPACYTRCVADQDPETPLLDARCELIQTVPGGEERELLECLREADGAYAVDPASGSYVMPDEDSTACFALRTDPGALSEDSLDDIAPYCTDLGANVEFQIAYAAGYFELPGTSNQATCITSDEPEQDCPDLF